MDIIRNSDCLEELKKLSDNSLEALCTDPPAGISFMNKEWDHHKGGRDEWIKWMTGVMKECLRVLKPGAHGLVWALPRTSHWTATALENAGFEIRDSILHCFGTGFPKSLDISKAIDKSAGATREVVGKGVAGKSSIGQVTRVEQGARPTVRDGSDFNVTAPATDAAKQWQGFGTALKPAVEIWWLIRKPISEKTVAKNVLRWGVGGLNIDGSRIGTTRPPTQNDPDKFKKFKEQDGNQGRFPANLVFDESAAEMLDEQSGELKAGVAVKSNSCGNNIFSSTKKPIAKDIGYSGAGGASRFFYVAKASKSERGENNSHPTVKSLKLMQYLIKLITPPNGTVLDPFMGSGSTGVAAKNLGFGFIGIEKEKEYFEIAKKRIKSEDITYETTT